jgi:hypothetical protein
MDTWGALPKSQVDAQTILEAVAALITAHNDDPDSHLDVGQSLQSHKASEIIDHLAFSVVRDKIIFDRFVFDGAWQSLDAVDVVGTVIIPFLNCMSVLPATGTIGDIGYAFSNIDQSISNVGKFTSDPNWQVSAMVLDVSQAKVYYGMLNEDMDSGAGFRFQSSNLYAIYFNNAGAEQSELITAVTDGTWYDLRFSYDNSTDDLNFYVNGSLVYTANYAFSYNVANMFRFENTNISTGGSLAYAASLHFDSDK